MIYSYFSKLVHLCVCVLWSASFSGCACEHVSLFVLTRVSPLSSHSLFVLPPLFFYLTLFLSFHLATFVLLLFVRVCVCVHFHFIFVFHGLYIYIYIYIPVYYFLYLIFILQVCFMF